MYKDKNHLQINKRIKTKKFAIYFNCVSFCWGANDNIIQISDSKNRKRNLGNQKIKITDDKDLQKFVKQKLKDVGLGKIIDTVFRNETEHLVHEIQQQEIARSDQNFNYLDFMIKKKEKLKLLERNQKKDEFAAFKFEEKKIIDINEKGKNDILQLLEKKQNKHKKQLTMSIQNQFFFNFNDYSYIHDTYSKAYYLETLLTKNKNYDNFEDEILKFDLIKWKKKSDFYDYCVMILPIFFKFFDFTKMSELIKKIDQCHTIMDLLFDYDLNNKSFKEIFFIFIIELMINSLNLINYIVNISKQIKYRLKINLKRISIKNFLIYLEQNLSKIILRLKQNKKYKEVTQVGCIQLEESFVFECHTYYKFPTKRFSENNLSHKRVFLQKLINCQYCLFRQQKHVAQLQLDQIIRIGNKLKDIYNQIKIDNMKKFYSKYTHELYSPILKKQYNISKFKPNKQTNSKTELSCSICKIKIEGLTYICVSCSHGGHFEHINQWFSTYDYCPECINCKCNLKLN